MYILNITLNNILHTGVRKKYKLLDINCMRVKVKNQRKNEKCNKISDNNLFTKMRLVVRAKSDYFFFILPHKLEYIRENNAKTPTHYKTIMFG